MSQEDILKKIIMDQKLSTTTPTTTVSTPPGNTNRSGDFRIKFWCRKFSKKTTKIFDKFLKSGQIKK